MICGFHKMPNGEINISGFTEIPHEVNTEGEPTYLGGSVERQVYQCGWCGIYLLETRIRAVSTGRILSQEVREVGWDLKRIPKT